MEQGTLEQEFEITFTQSELNTIALLFGYVEKDAVSYDILRKLHGLVDDEYISELYESLQLRQHTVECSSVILPVQGLSMWENGYSLSIKD
jgi:hypothetical protein